MSLVANRRAQPLPPMLDVRLLARDLGVQPIELVREMQADDVPLLPVSVKRWRVAEPDWLKWKQDRQAKAAEMARQQQLRMRHVAGAERPTPAEKGKVRFSR